MPPRPTTKGPIGVLLAAVALSFVLTVIAAWAAGDAFWFPIKASTVAPQVDNVFNVITWISIFFLILVTVLMVWFVIKYRRVDHTTKATSDVTHNTPLELTWTIIPLILVIAIFYIGMEGYLHARRAPAGAYEVNVTAQRWTWSFRHRNGCQENVLRVPVNRPVRLIMQSTDVLHALYIPAFRVKQDVVPGRIIDLWFEATEIGTFDLFCAEYCGRDHSRMHTVVIVQSEEDFQRDVERCRAVFEDAADEDLPRLARELLYPRCQSCHSLDASIGIGPSFRNMWSDTRVPPIRDAVFTDGTNLHALIGPGNMFETPEEYIRQSIINPQQKIVVPFAGTMPTFQGQLSQREMLALIEMIKRLDIEFDAQGNHLGSQAVGAQ